MVRGLHQNLVGAADVVARRAGGLRPGHDHGAEGHVDAAAVADEAALVDQVQCQRAELARRGVVAIAHAEDLRHAHVPVRRGIRVAVHDPEVGHAQQDQVDQVLVGIQRRRNEVGKDVGDGAAQRIGRDRQLPQRVHAMALEPRLELRVFAVDGGVVGLHRHVDARLAQERQPDAQRQVEAAERGVERGPQARQVRAEDAVARHLLQCRQARLGDFERTGHEFGLAARGARGKAVLADIVLAEEVERGAEEAQGRMVCRCGLGLASGLEVEPGEAAPLVGRIDRRPREPGLRGNREHLRRHGRVRKLAARDLQVQRCALLRRDRGVGRFAEAIVAEHPVTVLAADAAGLQRRFERRFEAAQRVGAGGQARGDGERFARGTVAKAGKQLQHGLRGARQLFEAARQQVDDIVDARMGRDALQAPAPGRGLRIVGKQAVVGEEPEQVLGKERVAPGLAADHLGQRTERIGILLQCLRDQFAQGALVERAEFHGCRVGHFGKPARAQRMVRVHLLGAERADQQQRLAGILVKQALEHLQGSRIRPLQVVQPQQQGPRGRCKAGQQACHAVEHALPFDRGCGVW